MNFTSKQKNMMVTLGFVSDREMSICYEGFCEADCEMRANGIPGYRNFTQYLEGKVKFATVLANLNIRKALEA